MGTNRDVPTLDPQRVPHRVELLHSSERTRVTRLFLPDGTVICKEPLGSEAAGRLRHETVILERLGGVEGVARVATAPSSPDSLVLEDVGGTALASTPMPLDGVQ